jgi:hypothetical protein
MSTDSVHQDINTQNAANAVVIGGLAARATAEFYEEKLRTLEEQLEALRLALHAIADEGSYLDGTTWVREPAVIAALVLAEVSGLKPAEHFDA